MRGITAEQKEIKIISPRRTSLIQASTRCVERKGPRRDYRRLARYAAGISRIAVGLALVNVALFTIICNLLPRVM